MPKFVPRRRKQQKTRRKGFDDEQAKRIPSKKQKRLEKYIENKLRKEENLVLLKKLAQSKVETGSLQSSRNLKRKHADFLSDLQQPDRRREPEISIDDYSSDFLSSSEEDRFQSAHQEQAVTESLSPANVASEPSNIGRGLKEPLAIGVNGLPIIPERKGQEISVKALNENESVSHDVSSPDWGIQASNFEFSKESPDSSELESSGVDSIADENSEPENASEESEESFSISEAKINLKSRPKIRESAFKTWATQSVNDSVGFTPSSQAIQRVDSKQNEISRPKPSIAHPLPPQSQSDSESFNVRKAYYVPVSRSQAIQVQRSELPIIAEEQRIMEAIHNHPIVIMTGDTGSGKTTQLPQFLLEAGYGDHNSQMPGMIGITQPRRVAAVSMAKRVAVELGNMAEKVSYKIRFDDKTSSKTAIKFMTDGILLREITQDFALTRYSIIVLDEAHERTVNTDMLIGMLTRIVDLRKKLASERQTAKPLQLVVMSATLHTRDILQNAKVFRHGMPPLIDVEGRQFPVVTHWSRRTQRDYLEEMFRKVCKGHRKLPPGAFLVFLNGENEIRTLQRRLEDALPSTRQQRADEKVQLAVSEIPLETEDLEFTVNGDLDEGAHDGGQLEIYGDGDDDDMEFEVDNENNTDAISRVHILPLYSQLRTAEQMRIFEVSPQGSRLIVLATNVAETSLTIPGVRFVFDCGRSKQRRYDQTTGIQSYEIGWISKASAKQRSGRAGRTGPGHCYRLYSSAIYEQEFTEHTEPEIVTTPIESVVIQLKSMGIDNVQNFPFPTSPSQHSLVAAEQLLRNLGLIGFEGKVTKLGREASVYPLSPRLAKMLAISCTDPCLPYIVALVAALGVAELFVPENQLDLATRPQDEGYVYTIDDQRQDSLREERKKKYNRARNLLSRRADSSDALKMLTAVCAYADGSNADQMCDEFFLRPKALKEALQLRQQLTSIIRANYPERISSFQADLPPLDKKNARISAKLKQLIAAGYLDQIAMRADMAPTPAEMPSKPRRAIDVPYLPLIPLSRTSSDTAHGAVFIHPTSILASLSPSELPQYLIYSHLQRATASFIGGEKTPKTRMFPLTPASGNILAALADGTPLLSYGKPIGKVNSLGGQPEKRECWVIPSLVGSAGSIGWPLPARKVLQRKDPKKGWDVEEYLTSR